MVRISAVVAVGILALLLGLTILGSFTRVPAVVLPTGGVTNHGPQDAMPSGETASQALRARTRLQEWRGVSGPAPAAPEPPGVGGLDLQGAPPAEATPAVEAPSSLVERWSAQREKDWQILRDRPFAAGTVTLPDSRAEVLVQAQGRDWRRLHNETVTYGGGYVIFGMGLLLALFLALRGRVRISGGPSGGQVERFTALERANHWVTATGFIVLALTGLLLLYGQFFLKPLMGASAYSRLAEFSAYVHSGFAVPFVLGVAVMIVLWLRQNSLTWLDLRWLARGGGLMSDRGPNPSAYKFNAGQKLIFWAVVLGSLALLVSGLSLVFPFYWFDIFGMQWAQIVHATVGLVMIAIIVAHIYIGTVGMEGAFDAMWSGKVNRKWAEEHHDLWVRELETRRPGE